MITSCKNFLAVVFILSAGLSFGQIAEFDSLMIDTESSPMEEINDAPIDDIVAGDLLRERIVLDYQPIREADVFWKKRIWRTVDVREKLNKPFVYPDAPFFTILREGIENGDIVAYSGEEEKFQTPLFQEDMESILFDLDTITRTNPDTYEDELVPVRNELNVSDIKRFRIKEMWYFDEATSTMNVRILGIAPIIDITNDMGQYLGEKPLFWIYYPHARNYLSRNKVYIAGNDANPLSWDDYLTMRFFSSYIYQESNVDGMKLADYPSLKGDTRFNGVQRMLASEKIKKEIFNFEHDLWSY